VMVDGFRATVEVFGWSREGGGWDGHRYRAWEGAHLYWHRGRWRRDLVPGEGVGLAPHVVGEGGVQLALPV
jgi:hypothetical protein